MAGLVEDVALVTSSEVEEISGEAELGNLDSGSATVANAAKQATNWLILWARGVRGIDPSTISNTSELKTPAAHHAAFMRLDAQPGEDAKKRAVEQRTRRDEALKMFVVVSTSTGERQTLAEEAAPRVYNRDGGSVFGGIAAPPGRVSVGPFQTPRS